MSAKMGPTASFNPPLLLCLYSIEPYRLVNCTPRSECDWLGCIEYDSDDLLSPSKLRVDCWTISLAMARTGISVECGVSVNKPLVSTTGYGMEETCGDHKPAVGEFVESEGRRADTPTCLPASCASSFCNIGVNWPRRCSPPAGHAARCRQDHPDEVGLARDVELGVDAFDGPADGAFVAVGGGGDVADGEALGQGGGHLAFGGGEAQNGGDPFGVQSRLRCGVDDEDNGRDPCKAGAGVLTVHRADVQRISPDRPVGESSWSR